MDQQQPARQLGRRAAARSSYTRTGVRRSGDDYQDLVALDLLLDFLEHPGRYEWVRVEADDVGALDDVVAQRSDGTLVARQVKFSASPASEEDRWDWDRLLERKTGRDGRSLPSLLQRWADGLTRLRAQSGVSEVCLWSNRRAAEPVAVTLTYEQRVDFDRIGSDEVRQAIVDQLGSEAEARSFFADFQFLVDKPDLDVMEDALRRRFYMLGGTEAGWLSLKDDLRFWVRRRDEPPPAGAITLSFTRRCTLASPSGSS